MIESWWFVLAMIAVLMIPGPTNALLASSAHQQGIAKTSMLIPAELFGYAYAISLWALLIHLSAPIWPYFIDILHILSAGYVFWMAFHLWKQSHLEQHSQKHPTIRPAQLFKKKKKNPKALLFAAGIFPVETWNNPTNVAVVYVLFSLVLLPTALFWMSFGRVILARETKKVTADLLYKGSALLLVVCMLPVVARFF